MTLSPYIFLISILAGTTSIILVGIGWGISTRHVPQIINIPLPNATIPALPPGVPPGPFPPPHLFPEHNFTKLEICKMEAMICLPEMQKNMNKFYVGPNASA